MSMKKFKTRTNKIILAVTTEQMREIDRIATEETGPNLLQMMENAGRNLAELSMRLLGENWKRAKIVVLAGTGGNGGGGICAARHLVNRNAQTFLCITHPQKLNEVVSWQRNIYRNAGGIEVNFAELRKLKPDLIIDAIIGYSLHGAPDGKSLELINWANSLPAPILSLNVPSGIDATTGENPGVAVNARWTMTLALPKTGLCRENTGALYLADIGIPLAVYEKLSLNYLSPFENEFVIPLFPEDD